MTLPLSTGAAFVGILWLATLNPIPVSEAFKCTTWTFWNSILHIDALLVISSPIPKSMRKRLCRLTLRDFLSSQPNRTPPHLIFQDQTPQLASEVSSSQSYLTPASPSQQESVQSTFPSQVLLFEEINSFLFSYRNCKFYPIFIIWYDSSASRYLLPTWRNKYSPLRFTIKDFLRCTEKDCEATIVQQKWSCALQSLTRHLTSVHRLSQPTVVRWYGKCKIQVPIKISSHKCLRTSYYFHISQEIIDSQEFGYKFLECNLSFPSATSLSSHSHVDCSLQKYNSLGASTLKVN